MIKASDRLSFIDEYYFSRKVKEINYMLDNNIDVINLGIGNPDLPPPESFLQTFHNELTIKDNHGYQSYKGLDCLRKSFSIFYKNNYNIKLNYHTETLPLIGSKEGIAFLSLAYINSGDTVLVPDPAYPVYESQGKLLNANILKYDLLPENNWQPDIEQIKSFDLNKVKIIWINYPNMPTGAEPSNKIFDELYALSLKYNFILCNDNPYSMILNTKPPFSIFQIDNNDKHNLIELNSISKSHNLAGLRIGTICGDESIIKNILKIKSNFDSGIYKPTQIAASKALLEDSKWFSALNKEYSKRKIISLEIFKMLNIKSNPTNSGMFIWGKIPDQYKDSYEMSDFILNKHHIFLTPGAIFGKNGAKYLRLSLASPEQVLQKALNRIS